MITEEHFQELDKLLKTCMENEELLNEWEQGFVSEWCDKLETYQTTVRVSDKQQAIFDRLKSKMEKAGV